ncbi:Mannose-1-phosphate guanylyltransferase/mannose-6-phosphate [Desulfonema limicola]|uniref:mannose-1-phosphate guanylyltransferase n=1 Tax=Desulfonema limicola TaxID=45656 RepID=A0A975BAA7_9BACT|nr:mannose-1-phosphate guanylyltransferase/mannose-6-phosphate isomerase [Desulfonema limicola]QTA81587.1 Mannose-1-phosphate guanylyltransferase/mannose-6-phosphate [Desulfonema limicola]
MIYPVILAGGSGTRLWPLSRELYPKQLLELTGNNTMLQDTILRLSGIEEMESPIIICNENHRFMVAEQMRNINVSPDAIILEPVGRNTAPAVAVAALKTLDASQDSLILILPADHFIKNTRVFHQALNTGIDYAKQGYLITFGIIPEAPETGYGYICKGEKLGIAGKNLEQEAYSIKEFVEKPDTETAAQYVNSGNYCWNSGMFMFKSSQVLGEMRKHVPGIVKACENALKNGNRDLDFFRLDKSSFEACPSDSVDYAIMEKTENGVMIPFQAGWNDLGSWEALWQVGKKDDNSNVVYGDVLLHDVDNSFLHASTRLLAAVGLKEHIVVETADAVLISPRNRVQDVKSLVNKLKAAKREETISHKTSFMPWGISELLVKSKWFQVKRLKIKAGAVISLQKHFNRAEHWIVLQGTALVTKGEEEIILTEDHSTYIRPGVPHRLVNPGKIPLEIIEVQSGSYIGSDDIVRLDNE